MPSSLKKKAKNGKALQKVNLSLVSKDKQITRMEKNIADPNDQLGRLNLELNEAKLFTVDAFQLGFKKVIRQSKHFFASKELNINLHDSPRILEDILG